MLQVRLSTKGLMKHLDGTRQAGVSQALRTRLMTEGLVGHLEDPRLAGVVLMLQTRLLTEEMEEYLEETRTAGVLKVFRPRLSTVYFLQDPLPDDLRFSKCSISILRLGRWFEQSLLSCPSQSFLIERPTCPSSYLPPPPLP